MNVRDLLFALLRYAIKGEALDKGAVTESLTEKRLAALFKVSKNHDVAHLVAYALEENGFCLEGEAWQLFLKEKEQAKLRYEMIQADINEICACFEKEGIEYIPLKGAAIRSYYPEPWMRTSCDIDILVHENDLDRAVDALVKNHAYTTDYKKNYHDISLYSPFGMHLELHHNIKENEEKYDKILTQVWEFSLSKDENSLCRVLQNEFLVFHLCAHMAYHFIHGGCGARSILDLWIINGKLHIDESKLFELLKKADLDTFFEACSSLAKHWFGEKSKTNDEFLSLEKYILLGGIYGTKQQRATAEQVKKHGKIRYFWSRVFMPFEKLSILYPIIKKHKVLTPICQIMRWFKIIFHSKRIVHEVGTVLSVDENQKREVASLLEKLGL